MKNDRLKRKPVYYSTIYPICIIVLLGLAIHADDCSYKAVMAHYEGGTVLVTEYNDWIRQTNKTDSLENRQFLLESFVLTKFLVESAIEAELDETVS